MENLDLPKGWFKQEVVRKSGLSAGKTDIYYYGPDGKKYRSKPQIARELGNNCDLTPFDFKSGTMMSQSTIVRRAKSKKTAHDFAKGIKVELNLSLPVRQTASIFKQPVTVIRSHPDSQVRQDLKHGPADALQPRQLFWEKSLTNLKCSDIDEETLKSITLPSKIKGIGPELSTENLLQSIAAALHLNSHPVVGQSQSVAKFSKNPTVHINTNQPLIQQAAITDEDIRQQESKVEGARRKLEELLAAIEKSNREKLVQGDRPLSADPSEGSVSPVPSPVPSPAPFPTAGATGAQVEGRSRKRKASPNRSPEEGIEVTVDLKKPKVVEESKAEDMEAAESVLEQQSEQQQQDSSVLDEVKAASPLTDADEGTAELSTKGDTATVTAESRTSGEQKVATPDREETTTGGEETTPDREETTTSEEETTNGGEETTTGGEETTPNKDEEVDLSKEETTPDKEETTPDKEETTPDKEETTPDEEVTTPDEEVTTPDEEVTRSGEVLLSDEEDATVGEIEKSLDAEHTAGEDVENGDDDDDVDDSLLDSDVNPSMDTN